VKSLKRRRCY
nr:Chain C, peptide [synthetic construct]